MGGLLRRDRLGRARPRLAAKTLSVTESNSGGCRLVIPWIRFPKPRHIVRLDQTVAPSCSWPTRFLASGPFALGAHRRGRAGLMHQRTRWDDRIRPLRLSVRGCVERRPERSRRGLFGHSAATGPACPTRDLDPEPEAGSCPASPNRERPAASSSRFVAVAGRLSGAAASSTPNRCSLAPHRADGSQRSSRDRRCRSRHRVAVPPECGRFHRR